MLPAIITIKHSNASIFPLLSCFFFFSSAWGFWCRDILKVVKRIALFCTSSFQGVEMVKCSSNFSSSTIWQLNKWQCVERMLCCNQTRPAFLGALKFSINNRCSFVLCGADFFCYIQSHSCNISCFICWSLIPLPCDAAFFLDCLNSIPDSDSIVKFSRNIALLMQIYDAEKIALFDLCEYFFWSMWVR